MKDDPSRAWRHAYDLVCRESDSQRQRDMCAHVRRLIQDRMIVLAAQSSQEQSDLEEALRHVCTIEEGVPPRDPGR